MLMRDEVVGVVEDGDAWAWPPLRYTVPVEVSVVMG